MKKVLAAVVISAGLAMSPAFAQPENKQNAATGQFLAGLVNVAVGNAQVAANLLNNINIEDVNILNNALNNNRVLTNFLNNNDIDIDLIDNVTVAGNQLTVVTNVLSAGGQVIGQVTRTFTIR